MSPGSRCCWWRWPEPPFAICTPGKGNVTGVPGLCSFRFTLTPTCRLKHLFESALGAWFEELDGASLLVITDPAPSYRKVGADAVHGRVWRRPVCVRGAASGS